ncbi:MAG: hypothetical protein GQ574_28350 [Crocinitomix sp.]|nr:hypothetical protein [Crocinitomix sp.]
MKKLFALIFMTTLLSSATHELSPTINFLIKIDPIDSGIGGAGCYYSLSENSKTILFINAVSGAASMKIDGKNQTFVHSTENRNEYKNDEYSLFILTEQIESGHESTKEQGFITITSKEGEIIKTKVFADCGA